MDWPADLFQITVLVAVLLFVLKEALEGRRRHVANVRKKQALRGLLSRECERNLWTIKSVHRALEQAQRALRTVPTETFEIVKHSDGREYYERRSKNTKDSAGGALASVRREAIEAVMLDVAELDQNLSARLEGALEALGELDHVRGSLISHAARDQRLPDGIFYGFTEYGLETVLDVYESISDLYKACTGKRLTKQRLR